MAHYPYTIEPKTSKTYYIVANLKNGKEIVDSTTNRDNADYLAAEYSMAYKCNCYVSKNPSEKLLKDFQGY